MHVHIPADAESAAPSPCNLCGLRTIQGGWVAVHFPRQGVIDVYHFPCAMLGYSRTIMSALSRGEPHLALLVANVFESIRAAESFLTQRRMEDLLS